MKFRKVLAGILAGGMLASVCAMVGSAESSDTEFSLVYNVNGTATNVENLSLAAWGSQWVQLYGLDGYDLSNAYLEYSITTTGVDWDYTILSVYGWDNSAGENYTIENILGTANQTEYTGTIDFSKVTSATSSGFGFNIQGGHADTTTVNYFKLVIPAATTEAETTTEEETTTAADETTTAAGETTTAAETTTSGSNEAASTTDAAPMLPIVIFAICGLGALALVSKSHN